MTSIQVFQFKTQDVRVTKKDGQPWWVAKDVCDVLGLENARQALTYLDDDERCVITNDALRKNGPVNIINEPGLYSLILRSRKPEAKTFKRWITHEVLPTIRKTGGYLNPEIDFTDYENLRKVFDAWEDDRKKLADANKVIKKQEPIVNYYNRAMASQNAITMNEAAKILKIPGVGQNTLFKALRKQGILMVNNVPYQKYINNKWFKVIEQPYKIGDEEHIRSKTLVMDKGLMGIHRIFSSVNFIY